MKNIVICCDGTGNEISENISNVLKLYREIQFCCKAIWQICTRSRLRGRSAPSGSLQPSPVSRAKSASTAATRSRCRLSSGARLAA